jgi:hypothetical protein
MSHELPTESRSKARPETPIASSSKEKKKAKSDSAVNNAIKITRVAKDATETVPLLAPLKVTMGSLIMLLENIKVDLL